MIVLIIFLVTILMLIGVISIIKYREIENITAQLDRINSTETNSAILLSTRDKRLKRLANEINRTLDMRKDTEVKYKRMETELRQAIGNISHDLRTPLTSISGYLQLIEDVNISEEERGRYIEIIKKRTEALGMLIASFYELSRLEAKEYKLNLGQINLINIMEDTLISFYKDFEARQIEPTLALSEKPVYIVGDENGVRRVITNLIQNILRYSVSRVNIYAEPKGGNILTVFKNDTVNLKTSDIPHLFERFFTSDNTRSSNSTGLGLSIAKQLVEQMGHKIYAEFSEGELSIIIEWKLAN